MSHNISIPMFLFGELTAENTKEVVSTIINCNRIIDEKPSHLELYINSQGGPVYYAMAIINVMKESVIPIHTICLGNASSSAAHIFIQGHSGSRRMSCASTLMFHASLLGYDTCSIHVLEAERKHNIFIECWFNDQVLENSTLGMDFIEKEFGATIPRYVTEKEAVMFGLCDINE